MIHPVIVNPVISPLGGALDPVARRGVSFPADLALLFRAKQGLKNQAPGNKNPFMSSILGPQYNLQADGSYALAADNVPVDVIGGRKMLRTCGAVTNLFSASGNIVASPSGVVIAGYAMTETAVSGAHEGNTSIATTAIAHTLSFKVKRKVGNRNLNIGISTSGGGTPIADTAYDLTTGAVLSGPGSPLVSDGNGWWIYTSAGLVGGTGVVIWIGMLDGATKSYTGDDVSSLEFSCVQLTASAYPLPYTHPGTTMPASHATTTNGPWFGLPQYDDAETSDGLFKRDGVELVVNGGFDSDTAWSKQTGWSIGGGKANAVATEYSIWRIIDPSIVVGSRYLVSFEISNYISGNLRLVWSGFISSMFTANGRYTVEVTATNIVDKVAYFDGQTAAFTGSIDNISIQKLIPAIKTNKVWAALTGSPMTLAWRGVMGVGGGDLPANISIMSLRDAAIGLLYIGDGFTENIVRSYDGVNVRTIQDSWLRGDTVIQFVQVNVAGTQFRVGYIKEGTHINIQWSGWTIFDGSFNPSTLYKLMLGYNNIYPMWHDTIALWNKRIDDTTLLKEMLK